MDPGTKDVLGATVPVKRAVLLAAVEAVKNAGLVTAQGKKGVLIATGRVMICGIISALGAGGLAIVIVHHVLGKVTMNASHAMAPDKKTAHGVGVEVTKTAITVPALVR